MGILLGHTSFSPSPATNVAVALSLMYKGIRCPWSIHGLYAGYSDILHAASNAFAVMAEVPSRSGRQKFARLNSTDSAGLCQGVGHL